MDIICMYTCLIIAIIYPVWVLSILCNVCFFVLIFKKRNALYCLVIFLLEIRDRDHCVFCSAFEIEMTLYFYFYLELRWHFVLNIAILSHVAYPTSLGDPFKKYLNPSKVCIWEPHVDRVRTQNNAASNICWHIVTKWQQWRWIWSWPWPEGA